jgi:protein-S-isoprenylcysteine O-methyltransferase Ste14
MNGYDQSIADLIRTTIHDAQDLVRGEIALAKTELRQELRRVGLAAAALTSATVAAIIAVVFLLTAVATGISVAFGWAVWTGFAIVGGVMILVAITLGLMGRNRLSAERRMPLTTETMKENVQWTQARRP